MIELSFARVPRVVRFTAGALLAVVLGCTDLAGPHRDETLNLQTDALSYVLVPNREGLATQIPYTFTNRTAGSVYLVNCLGGFGLHLERREGQRWESVWGPVLPSCLSEPIVIPPGALFADTVHVWGGVNADVGPTFDPATAAGRYRLVWDDAYASFQPFLPWGDTIPLQERTSNEFELQVAIPTS